ncbi:hypothetical protein TNCV_337921 [Trichonephila clavipes]|nr:hypothetical protein TNCV_337921 [Trichonephila clavipes]
MQSYFALRIAGRGRLTSFSVEYKTSNQSLFECAESLNLSSLIHQHLISFEHMTALLNHFLGSEDKLLEFENSALRKRIDTMETDPPPPNWNLETCSRIFDVFEYQLIKKTRLTYNQQILFTMDNGLMRKNQESYDLLEKENGKLMEEIQGLEGELTLIGTCPLKNCKHHSKLNPSNLIQKANDCIKLLESKYQKSNTKYSNSNPSPNPPKKKNRLDGFTAPTKVVKKQKVLQNYSFGAAAPVTTTNKYQTLSGNDELPTQSNTAMPVAAPKIPHSPKI